MDHSGHHIHQQEMDQSHHNMDYSQHDMDYKHHNMNHDMGLMHQMMSMSFHFGTRETVLFEFWKFATISGLIGSVIGIFILAVLYEGLKYYREHLFWRTYNLLQYGTMPSDKTPLPTETTNVSQRFMFSKSHILQTFLHIIQIVISYFLMLIFMTYNVWLGLAVALGSTTGFFLFGWKKSVVVDVTEHCH